MSVTGDVYRFDSGVFTKVEYAMSDQLSVADSFYVFDSQSVGLPRHFERFATSVQQHEDVELESFFQAAVQLIPAKGEWFPRLEYRANQPEDERLFLRIRPAPERTETLVLHTCNEPDLRESPKIKGPDLSLCQKYRRMANLHGADEAVLLSEDGFIADGALSSIVWIKDETLFAPDDSTIWLPSITREIVFELASQAGMQTVLTRARPEDLAGFEVWSLSALQGIRAATSWSGVEIAAPKLYLPFRKRLAMLATSIKPDASR
jgi:branched-subunit amino acid aminotransferase/4-amino-4-deoxychorismate lyase